MSDTPYVPPKVWTWQKANGGRFANINRPVAGATHELELPRGKHPLQLYSLGTPNGIKVTVMLEELLALGHSGAEYDAWLIRISEGMQFSSGFVGLNQDRSFSIWPKNSKLFCQPTLPNVPNACLGSCGKWAVRLI